MWDRARRCGIGAADVGSAQIALTQGTHRIEVNKLSTKQADGLLSDKVTVGLSPDGRTVTFTWPSDGTA